MSGVNLDDTEARFAGTARRGGKGRNDVLNAVDGERSGHRILIGEGQRTRGNDVVPASLTFGNRSVSFPRGVSAGLATGMGQLYPSHAALLMNKPHDSREWLDVIIHPYAQVLWSDPALGKNCSCFGKHQSSTAYCAAPEVHEMPVIHVSASTGILAHRRDKYAVRKCGVPNREGIKKVSHGL